MKMFAVVGTGRNSGKTTTVEYLIRELSKKYRVGTIKKIHEENFTIDKKGKDSWRHAMAGAKVVVTCAPKEVAVIKKLENENRFKAALKLLECEPLDIVIIEGLPPMDIPIILAARSENDAKIKLEALNNERLKNIKCVSSLTPENFSNEFKKMLPVFNPKSEAAKIIKSVVGD